MGVRHVLNYKDTPDWGEKARSLGVNGKGVDIVVDVGGASTLQQSLKAVRLNGVIALTGVLGEAPDGKVPTLLDTLFATCNVRGVLLGSRKQFSDMNHFIETHDVKPVVDHTIFDLASAKEAYVFLKEQKHFSKVVIQIQ